MGWINEIVILVENSQYEHLFIANDIYQKDSKLYSQAECLYNDAYNGILFYSYKRQKYIPYWIIKEISKKFPLCNFTLLGDCTNFISGPGGIIRIRNGIIVDSYGFLGERQNLIEEHHPQKIFEWFKFNGSEEIYRNSVIKSFPKKWCNEQFYENLIPLGDPKELINLKQKIYCDPPEYGWYKVTENKNI